MRKIILTLVATAALLGGSAQAAERIYSVTSADGSGSMHSLWIQNGIGPMLGSDFRFDPAYVPVSGTYPTGHGILTLDDMTAMGSLIGSVYSTTA